MFDRVAFVWCGNSWTKVRDTLAQRPPLCTVALWPLVLDCALLGWDSSQPGSVPANDIKGYDIFLVNLFTDSKHVQQIKAVHPQAYVIALPDPYLELALNDPENTLIEQLESADAIGGRTMHDVAVYGPLFNKPAVWLPSPVGPVDGFREYWNEPKEDVLIATEHNGFPRSSASTIAALAIIQKRLDVPVYFYRPDAKTKRLAQSAGLNVIWREGVDYQTMAQATARARWGVDLYPGHSQGRNLQTHAMVGTPVVGSETNNDFDGVQLDPYCPEDAAHHVIVNWKGPKYEAIRKRAFDYTENNYGFDASRQRMTEKLEMLLS